MPSKKGGFTYKFVKFHCDMPEILVQETRINEFRVVSISNST